MNAKKALLLRLILRLEVAWILQVLGGVILPEHAQPLNQFEPAIKTNLLVLNHGGLETIHIVAVPHPPHIGKGLARYPLGQHKMLNLLVSQVREEEEEEESIALRMIPLVHESRCGQLKF